MDAAALRASWADAWRSIGVANANPALLDELLARYDEPQRAYHTRQHLAECLQHVDRERAHAEHPGEVALALWFHDAIYDLDRHDNEARSADWARQALRDAGAAPEIAERVHALVMATCHDAAPHGKDAQLLVDIDLAILGAPPARFDEYERQIRVEYAHIPPEVFEPRRREILGRFLARDPLYQTPSMRNLLEASARRNLLQAVR